MINKKDKLNYLFQKIEQNKIDDIRIFFSKFPELAYKENKDALRSINDWPPEYYCARYGYFDLLRYFLEELEVGEDITFLVLLSIHSGSLPVINYLFNKVKESNVDLTMQLYSSCNLGKINVAVFIMMRGAMVLDDDSYDGNSEGSPKLPICYNMSYREENGAKRYYDKDGRLVHEETEKDLAQPPAQRRIVNERKILVMSAGKSRLKEKKKVILIFRGINVDLLEALKKNKIEQRLPPKADKKEEEEEDEEEEEEEDADQKMEVEKPKLAQTSYYDVLETINSHEYLKRIWQKYLECKTQPQP
jgi:hypothetical protein